MYTARFSEQWELIDVLYGDAVAANTEKNTGVSNLGNYLRTVIIIHPVDVNDALDVDIEQATSASGALSTFDSGSKDVTIATTDDAPTVIEIRHEEFTAGYEYLNVEVTTANTGGGNSEYVVEIWGEPAYKPASTSNLEEVAD
jgi:hypothetical protein